MQIIIFREKAQEQQLCKEWYGNSMEPPYRFSMQLTAGGLVFRAARAAAASVHPEAREGEFREELWKYDAAEFFISTPSGDQYMEFNLSPNGAWWAMKTGALRSGQAATARMTVGRVRRSSPRQRWSKWALSPQTVSLPYAPS